MAVAGGLLAQSMSSVQDKKHDLFYRADVRAQKRVTANVKPATPARPRSNCNLV